MKLLFLAGGFLLSTVASTALATPQEESQELLGKAIQESAQIDMAQDDERGAAQEKLGLAIQNAAFLASQESTAGIKDQERLGRLIRDSAFLRYAQGELQQELGKTIVGLPLG